MTEENKEKYEKRPPERKIEEGLDEILGRENE